MKNTPPPQNVAEASDGGLRTTDLFGEVCRVDAEIRKMRHAVLIANRLKDGGRWKPEYETELRELRKKHTAALLERAQLDHRISSPNAATHAPGANEKPLK